MKKKSLPQKVYSITASLEVTVLLLLILSVIVIWGTLYQVNNGIYAAQERFFKAWFTTIGGVIPFPAVKTIVTLLSINLFAQLIKKRSITVHNAGFLIIHLGIAILVGSSALSSGMIQESVITLNEGQSADKTYDFSAWELTVIVDKGASTHTFHYPIKQLHDGKEIIPESADPILHIDNIYENCSAMIDKNDHRTVIALKKRPLEKEKGRNIPGITLSIALKKQQSTSDMKPIHVYAGIEYPTLHSVNDYNIALSIHPKTLILPVKIQLKKFEAEWHPGTEKAKSYRSTLRILGKNIDRDIVIEMNRPFRFESYAFYQMGYSGNSDGYSSTLAVVKNPLRFMPYISSCIIVSGMLFYFIVKMISSVSSIQGAGREKK